MSKVRGIRGAIDVVRNDRESIYGATKQLLLKLVETNEIEISEIVSIFFTVTDDLNADFPAYAARDLGMNNVPLLCAREMNVPGSMSGLIRVLIHVNTDKSQFEIKHQYLGATGQLRPDIAIGESNDDCHNEK